MNVVPLLCRIDLSFVRVCICWWDAGSFSARGCDDRWEGVSLAQVGAGELNGSRRMLRLSKQPRLTAPTPPLQFSSICLYTDDTNGGLFGSGQRL